MAQITFDQIKDPSSTGVGFFTLKNDGDEAIVRIMHDSIEDFDIQTTHPIQVSGKFRSVSCLRTPTEPLEKCPICQSGARVNQRIFVRLVQYTMGADGTVTAEPKVWERSTQYATILRNMLNEYGPLSDVIFKIRRNGAARSVNTTYDIMYANPANYNSPAYAKMPELFEGYSTLGTAVLNKNYEELAQFVATGAFLEADNNQEATDLPFTMRNDAPAYSSPVTTGAPPFDYVPPAPTSGPAYGAAPGNAPWERANAPYVSGGAGVNRPVRTY